MDTDHELKARRARRERESDLRDRFAIAALPFVLRGDSNAVAATHAYDMAEAMLDERKRRRGEIA